MAHEERESFSFPPGLAHGCFNISAGQALVVFRKTNRHSLGMAQRLSQDFKSGLHASALGYVRELLRVKRLGPTCSAGKQTIHGQPTREINTPQMS